MSAGDGPIPAVAAASTAHRAALMRLAYRMTGSLAEAEDLVQEAFVRFHLTLAAGEPVEHVRAYLYRVVTRLCLDLLKSARQRRETYPGPWLPEPQAAPVSSIADTTVELAEEVTMALLLALERLSPAERAVFVLRDAFDLDYSEIAATLERSEGAVRQLAARARAHVRDGEARYVPDAATSQRVFQAFLGAIAAGDITTLKGVLRDDAILRSDGGGRAFAAKKPIVGADRIAKFFVTVNAKHPLGPTVRVVPARVNGMPGVLLFDGEACIQALALDIDGSQVARIYAVLNPDKLTHLRLAKPIPVERSLR